MGIRTTVKFPRGQDQTLQLTVIDTAGAAVDVTGWTFALQVRKSPEEPDPEFTITPTIITATAGRVDAVIPRATTLDMQVRKDPPYRWDLWRIDVGNAAQLAYGDFELLEEVYRA